jgi:hypothetical protein
MGKEQQENIQNDRNGIGKDKRDKMDKKKVHTS